MFVLGVILKPRGIFFENFTLELKLVLGIDLWSRVKYQSNQNIFEISNLLPSK